MIVINLPVGEEASDADIIRMLVYDVRSCVQDYHNFALEYALRIGKHLIKLKATCKREGVAFSSLFPKNDEERGDPEKLPFVQRTGNRLMAIAGHQVLSNPTNWTHESNSLPTDWNTLYQLSRLPAPKLKKLIDAGEVSGDISRTAATKLVKESAMPISKKTNKAAQKKKSKMKKREAARDEFLSCLKQLKVEMQMDELRDFASELGFEITVRKTL
jgi:hypothetical protein